MDILSLLKKLGLSEKEAQILNKAYILRPKFYSQDNKLEITFKTERPIDCNLWQKCQNGFCSLTKLNCELIIDTNGLDYTGKTIRQYLDYFRKNDVKQELDDVYAQKIGDEAILVIPDKLPSDNQQLKKFIEFLSLRGIRVSAKPQSELVKAQETKIARPNSDSNYSNYSRPTNNNNNNYHQKDFSKSTEIAIREILQQVNDIYVIGEIFSLEYITTKKGTTIQIIGIHDGNEAITAKLFSGKNYTPEQMAELKVGNRVKIYGNVQMDDYAKSLVILGSKIEKEEPLKGRTDDAEEKRIELHAHTNKSEMDGVDECKDLLKMAHNWGMEAIAITDHSVVQAYPDAQDFLIRQVEKVNKEDPFKVIFGIELNVVDSFAKIVTNPDDINLGNAEYCVFDLETSGLSNQYDEIIEFGAVKYKNGYENGRKQMFIKPSKPLNEFTKSFTGITQENVNSGKSFKDVAKELLDFMKGTILVAHNGYFDYGFLEAEFNKVGIDFKMPMIDTLPLARILVPERSSYRLGNMAHYFHIDYTEDEAHRADYDAQTLGLLFNELKHRILDFEKISLNQLANYPAPNIYKKNHPYHFNLLAKDQQGIKDIYDLVTLSHTKYLTGNNDNENSKKSTAVPEARIIRDEVTKRRQHVLIGSGCQNSDLFEIACNRSQKELEECMKYYDYVEVQPPGNYSLLVDESSSFNSERLIVVLKKIIATADKLQIPVVATGDSHYLNPEDKIVRDVYIFAKRIGGSRHPMYYQRTKKTTCPDQHLFTTKEMLEAFKFLDPNKAKEIVIDNTHKIANLIEKLHPLFTDVHTPNLEGCDKLLEAEVYKNAKNIYGDPLPELVKSRLDREVKSVVENGFAVQYYIAYLLVKRSYENGYIVGSRGSVGSSFLATMAKVTEVNPLPPHYVCPKCHHSEFFLNGESRDGFDLPDKVCPECGTKMHKDGHNIPFETFLGFEGDKVPDIDLNFSGEYQNTAQLQIKEIFGESHVFAAGTIATAEKKTAYGYVKGYLEDLNINSFNEEKISYLANKCIGVKRTTGQHPAGIVVCPKENQIHDFTPLQYPANNNASPWMTTHFAISDLHDTILKLDILGHVDPTAIKLLQDMSGIDPTTIPFDDPETLSLFNSTKALKIISSEPYNETTGAIGLPEFGTKTSRSVLDTTKPNTFADLVSLEGLTHGTNVWKNNAQDLINDHICTMQEVIACRDDIMTYLMMKQLPSRESFDIMESVRHGRGLKDNWIADMQEHKVPQWYIESCQKINYMFPKAHAVAYCMMALRIAWFKVHKPEYFYACFFTCRADAYEIETMIAGEKDILQRMKQIETKKIELGRKISPKESSLYDVLEVAYEMYRRGYHFENIDLKLSDATKFLVSKTDPKGIIPPFTSIDGLGNSVAYSVLNAREKQPFISREDLIQRTQLNNTQLDTMDRMGVLSYLQESNQISLF